MIQWCGGVNVEKSTIVRVVDGFGGLKTDSNVYNDENNK